MTTPERIYIEVLNGEITPRWTPNREDKSDVEYIRADLNASIAAREEVEDLCKKVYRLHTENARLTALLTAPTIMTAEEVTEPGIYAFLRYGHKDGSWVVALGTDSGKIFIRDVLGTGGLNLSTLKTGQFIGPIKMPEVA
jgi:hypothetical protein